MFLIETQTSVVTDTGAVEVSCNFDADSGITYCETPEGLTMVVLPTGRTALFNHAYSKFIEELEAEDETE